MSEAFGLVPRKLVAAPGSHTAPPHRAAGSTLPAGEEKNWHSVDSLDQLGDASDHAGSIRIHDRDSLALFGAKKLRDPHRESGLSPVTSLLR